MNTLYLIPVPLFDDDPEQCLCPKALLCLQSLNSFIVEEKKSAWRILARLRDQKSLDCVHIELLNEHTKPQDVPGLFSRAALQGGDIGLFSEAGAPCVADPGALAVREAHKFGWKVAPLPGPSSILLALMASGFNGQGFSFHGYLPQDRSARQSRLKELERESRKRGTTQVFIETPYRSSHMMEDMALTLDPDTRVCIAANLTSPTERIRSDLVSAFRAKPFVLGKEPAVFLIYAGA